MLAGIYYGAMYGGSTTSILLNVPGETASVITCIDGYRMAQKGRAGPALAICAIGSFVAGTIGIFGLVLCAPPLARAALVFGPAEYFSLMVFGFIVLSNVTGGSLVKSLMMALVGLIVGTIGLDPVTGDARFTFGSMSLLSGIEFVAVAIGIFGIGEVLSNVAKPADLLEGTVVVPRLKDLFPTLADLRRSALAILRGTGIGFGCGLVPGPAPVIATYASYMVEKRISKHPQEFGHGAIEGVAGPESANNAACQSAFIPLFVLGIPFAPPTAILLGALLIHGVTPGPMLIAEQPELFWGVIASMYIGNFILLLLNLPFVPLFASILRVPEADPAAPGHSLLRHRHVLGQQLGLRHLDDAALRRTGLPGGPGGVRRGAAAARIGSRPQDGGRLPASAHDLARRFRHLLLPPDFARVPRGHRCFPGLPPGPARPAATEERRRRRGIGRPPT